ncbi:MAG TPA: DUF4011 domain-containing protein [Ktedonobacterales bacterium]|jgi:very-short-patch-repair endonuclease
MALESKLRQWQQDLIDMSRNNNLLYFQTEGRRRSGIELRFDNPDQIFFDLRREQKKISLDEQIVFLGSEAEPDLWERRLTRLRTQARDDLNNRGVNTLYVAFGLLEWKEASTSEEIIRSPLLLVPVALDRAGALGHFALQRLAGEETELNPTLRHKFQHDFGIALPEFATLDDELTNARAAEEAPGQAKRKEPTLDEALQELERRIAAGRSRLPYSRVLKTVHLGRFSFQKLAMYQDIQRNFEQFLDHPMLQVITNDRAPEPNPQGAYAANELDDKVAPATIHEVLQADSSQQEAIVAAKAGMSFVLQGPPGTGKSQTIANIIAECLGLGKTVLFVSEKAAALEVVRNRLREAGLDGFCLDLHDSRQDRKRFIQGLESALNPDDDARAWLPDREWNGQSLSLQTARDKLNTYVRELHEPRFALGKSVFGAYGEMARLHGAPDRAFDLANVELIGSDTYQEMLEVLGDLPLSATTFGAYSQHPWREIRAEEFTPALHSNVIAHLGEASALLGEYDELSIRIAQTLGDSSALSSLARAHAREERLALALESPQPALHWWEPGQLDQIRRRAQDALAHAQSYWTQQKALRSRFTASILTLDHQALLEQLTADPHGNLRLIRVAAGEPPQDAVIRAHATLEAQLTGVQQAISGLEREAPRLAELCLWPQPQSATEMTRLAMYAEALSGAAGAQLSWLDPAQFPTIRATLLDAMAHSAKRATLQAELDAVYLPTYFDLDLKGIAERFRMRYQSIFRYLSPQYYQDVSRLRSQSRPQLQRTAAQLETDLSHAIQLLAEITWEEEHRAEVTRMLGNLPLDQRTQWNAIKELLDATQRWLTFHPVSRPPDTLIEMVVSRAPALDVIRTHQMAYVSALETWRRACADLNLSVDFQAGVSPAPSLEAVPLTQLTAVVERLLALVRTLAQTSSAVLAHKQPDAGDFRWQDLCDALRSAQIVVAEQRWMSSRAQDLERDLGALDLGAAADWPGKDWRKALADVDWAARFLALYADKPLPETLKRILSDQRTSEETAALAELLASARTTRARLDQALTQCDTILPLDALTPGERPFEKEPLQDIKARVDVLLGDIDSLHELLVCKSRIQRCHDLGLGDLITKALDEHLPPEKLPAIFERRFYSLWLTRAWQDAPALATFRGDAHAEVIKRFQALDEQHETLARRRLHARLLARRQQIAQTEDSDMRRTLAELKRLTRLKRQRPIRRIIQQTSKALIQLKPCWMMSPLSISQFIDGDMQAFDLVIFDEASQVSPEDAICAIARGKRLIVVGDDKQLPPTRFFMKSLSDEEEDEDNAEEAQEQLARVDSILKECAALPQKSLLWHYRSQDESLIAFSNQHFYGGRLITFPAIASSAEIGVRFEYVRDGVYDRGGKSTNQREAERVVDLIVAHARRQEGRSLGVVALSQAQESAIREALDRRRRADLTLKAFERELDEYGSSFFIKNLESVQGDERDVIILSVGYGKGSDEVFRYNFGPLTRAGGERRLNVAVTRARQQLILVSSIRSEDFSHAPASLGVQTLRDYIEYAEQGPESLARQRAQANNGASAVYAQFDSPFEQAVYEALTQRGLRLATQVGCSGYRIDLAVENPARPGRYLLGIECDGRTYHNSKTARDRDRLRQQHLERMGWRIHRIWSSDWWRHPEGEIERILREVGQLRLQAAPIMDAPALAPSPAMTNENEGDSVDLVEAEELFDDEEIGVGAPTEAPASYLSEDELVAILKEGGQDFVDHRANGGTIWIIEREKEPKSEPYMRRLAREHGVVFEFVRNGHLATRYRPAWRLKRQGASTALPPTPRDSLPQAPVSHLSVSSAGRKTSEDALLAIARECDCEIVDHRANGGGFWVIKSKAASLFLLRATSLGFTFAYYPTGGRATKHQPAWYLKR